MKTFPKVLIAISIFLIAVPVLSPKYPEYQDISKTYDWGEIETLTTSHMIDDVKKIGYLDIGVAVLHNSLAYKNCRPEISKFKVKASPGGFQVGHVWMGKPDDYWRKDQKNNSAVLVSAWSSRTAQISDIDLSIEVKLGEGCETENNILYIDETLNLTMRRPTVWGYIYDVLMSV